LDAAPVVVVSEFGRRIPPNAAGGTDHGGATAMMVLGGAEPGGRVYGRWPGAAGAPSLLPTTDLGRALAELAARHALARPEGRGRTVAVFTY
jgi:uncharacterized protein (DUF1501 family)